MSKDDSNFLIIDSSEQTPLVQRLLSIIDSLQTQLIQQSEKIDLLLEENRRLKKLSPKPKIKPSTLPKEPKDPDDNNPLTGGKPNKKRSGSSS
jgi:hypothetical protein